MGSGYHLFKLINKKHCWTSLCWH